MFVRYNANPSGRRKLDCTVRAISLATGQSWQSAYAGICLQGFVDFDMPSSNDVWGNYLYNNGFHRIPIRQACPDCITVRDFCNTHRRGTYVLALDGHVLCVMDGDYYDSWDSGNEPVLYVWKRECD